MKFIAFLLASLAAISPASTNDSTAASFGAATVREPVSAAGSRMQFYNEFTAASFRAATVRERIPELLQSDTPHGPAARSTRPPPDPLIEAGFEHFYNIEYAESIAIFQQAIKAAPQDASRYNHLARSE